MRTTGKSQNSSKNIIFRCHNVNRNRKEIFAFDRSSTTSLLTSNFIILPYLRGFLSSVFFVYLSVILVFCTAKNPQSNIKAYHDIIRHRKSIRRRSQNVTRTHLQRHPQGINSCTWPRLCRQPLYIIRSSDAGLTKPQLDHPPGQTGTYRICFHHSGRPGNRALGRRFIRS